MGKTQTFNIWIVTTIYIKGSIKKFRFLQVPHIESSPMGNLIYIQTDNNRVFTHKTNVCEFFKKSF